jgi:hypothetical protein
MERRRGLLWGTSPRVGIHLTSFFVAGSPGASELPCHVKRASGTPTRFYIFFMPPRRRGQSAGSGRKAGRSGVSAGTLPPRFSPGTPLFQPLFQPREDEASRFRLRASSMVATASSGPLQPLVEVRFPDSRSL